MVSRAKLTQHTGKPGLLRLFFAIGTVAGTVLARENAAPAPGFISKCLDAMLSHNPGLMPRSADAQPQAIEHADCI
jgi:hypothetical protein